jgi:hypothetical protein
LAAIDFGEDFDLDAPFAEQQNIIAGPSGGNHLVGGRG